MSFVDPTTPAGNAPSGVPGQPGQMNQLDDPQTFLKLLVAQLKNQDPNNPMDPTSFMTEIAQLTAVQSQTALTAQEETVAADSMIGRTVAGMSSSGQAVGTVTGVLINSSGPPDLVLGGGSGATPVTVPLSTVTQVYGANS